MTLRAVLSNPLCGDGRHNIRLRQTPPRPQEGKQFAASAAPVMVNSRVEDLHALVEPLKEEGCNVLERLDKPESRKFA